MNGKTAGNIQQQQSHILTTWLADYIPDGNRTTQSPYHQELRAQSEALLKAIVAVIASGQTDSLYTPEFETAGQIVSEVSVNQARQGLSPRETGMYVVKLKTIINQLIKEAYPDQPQTLYEENAAVNQLMDSLTIVTFEHYIRGREEVITRQTEEIEKISIPVIRVWDGILALPIIGTLDSERTQNVMEALLREIVNTGSSIAILDISGVPAVDTLVAQHLFKTVSATRLMGAECIISGIRAEIAQTMVHLGIDLTGIRTKASMAGALKLAYELLNLEVSKKKAAPAI